MNIKTTIKLDDKVDTFNEMDSSFGSTPQNVQQLIMFKVYMEAMIKIIEDKDPKMKNKRIEVIMEFQDDGLYLVVGRKEKESDKIGT